MRSALFVLALTVACGPKAPPTPAVVTETPEPAPPPPPPMPEPEPEPAVRSNANFRIAIDNADGTSVTGRVVRVERGVDFYGADGFTDRDIKTTISLSGGGTARDVAWEDIATIDIDYSSDTSAISCTYDSSVTPWAYICTLPTTTRATTTDGATMDVSTRNVWRLTFDDDRMVDLYLFKLPVRQEDASSSGRRNQENPAMYVTLRDAVLEAAASAPTQIRVNP